MGRYVLGSNSKNTGEVSVVETEVCVCVCVCVRVCVRKREGERERERDRFWNPPIFSLFSVLCFQHE